MKHLPTGSKMRNEYIIKATVEPVAKKRILRFPELFSAGTIPDSVTGSCSSIICRFSKRDICLTVVLFPSDSESRVLSEEYINQLR
jgi:hypothetical protein